MATYLNDLRLKEIATGDESGTWGTSTNTNLSLIADAFSLGTKQLAANADETFTMPDAAADGTRSLYLKITSAVSLSVTRTVTLAPNTVSKVWIIENATTGGQSITIAQGSGATVTIANGSKVMVVTDGAGAGAAVTNANPTTTAGTVTSVGGTGTVNGISLSGTVTSSGNLTLGGTLANVSLTTQVTGTLPVANGGTGVTTSTGTSAVVLSNSPTLVTPLLGTPTSGNLSNCTADGTNAVGFKNIPAIADKTTSYNLQTADVGKVVGVGSGGSITIPDATFAAGDAVLLFNNTTGDITITCSITTAYIAGTDDDKATVTLATRGLANILFVSGTVCVISGNVS
jgi:hypothetical protein